MIAHIRANANIRGIIFDITPQYIWDLFISQNKKCALSGLDIHLGDFKHNRNRTASLERIDSNKGYIEGNVQWVNIDINKMKMDFGQEYFLQMCNIIANQFPR